MTDKYWVVTIKVYAFETLEIADAFREIAHDWADSILHDTDQTVSTTIDEVTE